MSTVILAISPREANAYARDKGIRASYAPNAAAVRAANHIIELASFSERRDRFEMQQAAKARARFIRGTKYVKDLDWTAPEKIVEEPSLASQVAPETWLFGDVPVEPAEEPAPSTPSPKRAPVKRNLKKKAATKPTSETPEVDPEVEF